MANGKVLFISKRDSPTKITWCHLVESSPRSDEIILPELADWKASIWLAVGLRFSEQDEWWHLANATSQFLAWSGHTLHGYPLYSMQSLHYRIEITESGTQCTVLLSDRHVITDNVNFKTLNIYERWEDARVSTWNASTGTAFELFLCLELCLSILNRFGFSNFAGNNLSLEWLWTICQGPCFSTQPDLAMHPVLKSHSTRTAFRCRAFQSLIGFFRLQKL